MATDIRSARLPPSVVVVGVILHGGVSQLIEPWIVAFLLEDVPTGLRSSPDNGPWPMATIGRTEAETQSYGKSPR